MTYSLTNWRFLSVAALAMLVMAMPEASFAETDPTDSFTGVLCELVSWFNGPVGRAIAMIAVITVGIGALMGKVTWGMAVMVAIGIAVIFGAASIVNALAAATVPGGEGGTNECTATE